MTTGKRWASWITVFLLSAIVGAALWLRWTYVRGVSLHVDEYITLRAAKQILDEGIPLLPTGNFYSHGLLLSYVESGIMALAGFEPLAARLPVLVISLLAVVLTWWVGYRWFSPPVGLLAAALLALTPEAIIWGGRARMYAPLQFFVLLALFFYWRALVQEEGWRDSIFFSLSFLGAMCLHAETMVLLPVLLLIALGYAWSELRRDGLLAVLRRWWQGGLIVAWCVAALGVLVELWFRQLGPPMVSRLAEGVYGPSGRVYVQPTWDWSGIRKTLEPLLTWPVVLGLAGLLVLALAAFLLRRDRDAGASLPEGWRPRLLYLVAVFGLTLFVLLFLADPSWKSPRYLFMLLPVFYLALAAAIFGLLQKFLRDERWQWVVLGVLVVLVVVGFWSAAQEAAHENVAGYDRAFEYVAAHRQTNDAVMTFVPQAAIFYLGRNDYLSVPTDYRGFAYEQGGRWLEGWDSIPLVDSGAGVTEVLAGHERLWFVVDEHRFRGRFAPGFVQAVWDGMDLVWRDGQVLVFRTADPPPPTTRQERRVDLGPISLLGIALETEPQPGMDLFLTLYWSTDDVPSGVYSSFVHLVDAEGSGWAQDDGPPLGEIYPTTDWQPGEVIRDRKAVSLPANLPDGLYRLEAGMYDAATMEHLMTADGRDRFPLGFVRVGKPETLSTDGTPVDVVFGEQIRLLSYSLTPTGDRAWTLTLVWAAETSVEADYTVFLHLVDETGEIQGQHDGPPGGGFYPTSFWAPAETVLDRHDLALAFDAPAGAYRLRVGLYQPETGVRLPVAGADAVELETWTIP